MNNKNKSNNLERSRLLEIAKEYKKKGYEVYIQPSIDKIPDFLQNYQPDLIALSAKDNVIVEIKSTKTLKETTYLDTLAKTVEKRKNWRLEFVLTNPKEQIDTQFTWTLLYENEIRERLKKAEYVYSKMNEKEFGILLLWVVIEATLQRAALSESIIITKLSPRYMIKEIYSSGIINNRDYQLLLKGIDLRNGIVHGYSSNISTDKIFKELVDLLERYLRILSKNIKFGEPRFIKK